MNMCQYTEHNLDSYLDKELSPEQMDLMNNHLNGCEQCRELVEKSERIQLNLHHLDQDIPIKKEKIWNNIKSASGQVNHSGTNKFRWIYRLSAAVVLVALGLSILLIKKDSVPNRSEMLSMIEQVQNAYELESTYFNRLTATEPQTEQMHIIVKNLQIINNAMAEIETVICKDPSNIALVQMFLEQHQMRMELMRRVISTSQSTKGESHEI
ncbi:MAG: hypothetical protein Kow00108_27230 [Calditrichia bacterium]